VQDFKELQMPRQTTVGQAFIASAKGIGDSAAIHKDTLIERGLPADFLDQFQTALAKLLPAAVIRGAPAWPRSIIPMIS
jgi:hypothetical protein